jgi:hypothetical protein
MSDWRVYISHDCCNDFTWGNDETSTRDNLAEILRAHLDAMTETDSAHPDEQDHYTTTTFIEALCFLEKYPERRDELVRRARERRLTLSPWLCNTFWGSMSVEGQLRAMSAARRLELEAGVPLDTGNHSEMPSLPLGAVPILAGAGVEWVVVPWLLYDTVYESLDNPPIFRYEAPDGSALNLIFDRYASRQALYIQGLRMLERSEQIHDWKAHYESWGESVYPLKGWLAAGTHHDLYPEKRHEVRPLNEKLVALNASGGLPVRLVNASLGRFVDEMGRPNLAKIPTERRSFGVSWEAWPVALARLWGDGRLAERAYLDAEALLCLATLKAPSEREYTAAARYRADDMIAMIGDHAWNGMDERSHRINQHLRRGWVGELKMLGETLAVRATRHLVTAEDGQYTLFNPLGHARRDIVALPETIDYSVSQNWSALPQQDLFEDGAWTRICVTPEVAGFATQRVHQSNPLPLFPSGFVTESRAEGVHFALVFDSQRSGLSSLVHRASGAELRIGAENLGETRWWAGRDLPLCVTGCELLAHGPVLTRLAQHAEGDGLRVTQSFSVASEGAVPLVHTPGALLKLAVAPEGDLHPGADQSRVAIDSFVRAGNVSVFPREAFLLRPDLPGLTFECLGNDQNAPEVSHDQGGERHFRFRYRVRFDDGATAIGEIARRAAELAHPITVLSGRSAFPDVSIQPDASRAVSLCLKPALDGRGLILRLWEVSGSDEPLGVRLTGFSRATACDLLERDGAELPLIEGAVALPIRGWGLGALRIE